MPQTARPHAGLRACALAALLLLAGCSGPAILNALAPGGTYRLERDIAYGPHGRQRLDLYRPATATTGAPLVVFFYGGRWRSGSKEQYAFVGEAFASRGYVVAIPDYRLYPEVRHAGFLEDAAAAATRAAAYLAADGPADRPVFLVGHSAGAYIAAMLALDRRWLDGAGAGPCLVDAGVGLAGPYDFLPLSDPALREIFGPGPAGPETQPISHADAADPPMLLATGGSDETVDPGNTRRLAERLRQAGGRAETRLYEGIGHVALVAALAAPLRGLAPVLDDADAFLRDVASRPRDACP